MGQIRNQQPWDSALRTSLDKCPNCGTPLLMFGCDNPRCVNYHGNKRFFYHEVIKTQAEIDKEFEEKDKIKNNATE